MEEKCQESVTATKEEIFRSGLTYSHTDYLLLFFLIIYLSTHRLLLLFFSLKKNLFPLFCLLSSADQVSFNFSCLASLFLFLLSSGSSWDLKCTFEHKVIPMLNLNFCCLHKLALPYLFTDTVSNNKTVLFTCRHMLQLKYSPDLNTSKYAHTHTTHIHTHWVREVSVGDMCCQEKP